MRRSFHLTLLGLLIFHASGAAQDDKLKSLQKQIESGLFKHAPKVKTARFDGCRLTLMVSGPYDGRFNPVAGRIPSVDPTDGVSNSPVSPGAPSPAKNETQIDIEL